MAGGDAGKGAAAPPSQITGSKVGITIVVMSAALMAMIDITIVNVALNDIRASFGTPLDQIGWVSTGYMMANIVVIPMTGWFQRTFGFRKYFTASIAVFTLASMLCGLAWNLPSLVAFRILQGLGGGAIIPTAQGILFARYPKAQHGMAAALFGLGAITGPLLGPSIGGYLIQWFSWHWIFVVNVPVGIVVSMLCLKFVQEPGFAKPTGAAARIDTFGIVMLAIGMPSLQYVLEEGNREGWLESTPIVILSAIAAIALITFVVHELEVDHPVVDLRVFKNRSYTAGTGLNFLTGFALFSGSYLFSLYCGSVMHYSALDIGKVFLCAGSISVVMMPLIGRVGPRIDGRYMLVVGVSVVAFSQLVASHLDATASFWDLVKPNLIRSFGLGFIFIPVSVLALSDLPADKRGNATGLFNLTRELGGSLGTALMGVLVTDGIKRSSSYLGENVTPYNPIAQETMRQISGSLGSQTFQRDLVAESVMKLKVTTQAMVLSFDGGFRVVAFAIGLGLVLILVLKKPQSTGPIEGAH